MNVQQLVQAVGSLGARDALQCRLTPEDWKALAPYLSIRFLRPGEPLIHEGEADRELFILAEGELQVSTQGHVISTLMPGTVVGEGTFFSGEPRSATVLATRPGVAWTLSWDKFQLLSQRQPRVALDLTKGLASVLAKRMREAVLVGQFT